MLLPYEQDQSGVGEGEFVYFEGVYFFFFFDRLGHLVLDREWKYFLLPACHLQR